MTNRLFQYSEMCCKIQNKNIKIKKKQKSENIKFGAVQECANVVLIFSREKDTCDHVVARRLHTRVEKSHADSSECSPLRRAR